MNKQISQADVVIIGSGPGGAVTALELASHGYEVLVIEEGKRFKGSEYGKPMPVAFEEIYRNGGMTPIMGSVPIGYVEGRCIGGSSEINCGFWRRLPCEQLEIWKSLYDLKDISWNLLEKNFEWAEEKLSVSHWQGSLPKSTQLFANGLTATKTEFEEIPRTIKKCKETNRCPSGCPNQAKQSMSVTIIPLAEKAGAHFLSNHRAVKLIIKNDHVEGVVVKEADDIDSNLKFVKAKNIFVCCGPTESPALLKRSGIYHNIGNQFFINPMIKVIAEFPEKIDSDHSVVPLLKTKVDSHTNFSLGGSFWSKGQVATILSKNRLLGIADPLFFDKTAIYYVSVNGRGKGSVDFSRFNKSETIRHYDISEKEVYGLVSGCHKLMKILLESGANRVYPAISGIPFISSNKQLNEFLKRPPHKSRLGLTAVHGFSSCPIGERLSHSAADSFGKIRGIKNLFVNDASMLPDAPAINPQGIIMALARRNSLHFMERVR